MLLSELLTEYKYRPSGAMIALSIRLEWPISVRNRRPVAISHNLIVESPAAAIQRPSGEKAIFRIA
jgi:bifunctional DNase/RNase